MTRHRKGDIDGDDEDVPPWRAKDYESAPPRPAAAGGYGSVPPDGRPRGAGRPARGALGTSRGRDDAPGETTGPPWERPGWDDSQPMRRAPRPGGLTGGHPSGPLPRVSSGPLPRVPPDSWPGAGSGPLPPVPESWDAEHSWPQGSPASPGGDYPGHSYGSERPPDGYSAEPYLDRADPGYPGHHDDAPYLRTGFTDPGYGGGRDPGQGYPDRDSGYHGPGYGSQSPGPDGYERDEYHGDRGYAQDGYGAGDYGHEPGYPEEPGYSTGPGYPAHDGYPTHDGYPAAGEDYPEEEHYPAGDGYADAGYGDGDAYSLRPRYSGDREAGYPGDRDGGYPAEDGYPRGPGVVPPRDARPGSRRDLSDDHGYGDRGGQYGDMDDDHAWADDDSGGILPGLGSRPVSRRPSAGAPGRERAYRAGGPAPSPSRSRSGGGGNSREGNGKSSRSAMRRAAPWIALTVVVVALTIAAGVGYYFYRTYVHPPDYTGPGTGSVTVHIQSGETATQVGQQLMTQGVVESVRAFSNAAKASGHGSALEPGYYRLHEHMAAALAFALLLKPSSRVEVNLLVLPGQRLYEIIDNLGKETGNLKGYQQAAKDTAALGLPPYAKGNPEGYLFPATYTAQPGTSPTTVLREMVQRFGQEAASADLAKWARKDQVSEGDIIITASICQAEGRSAKDMAKIARVIYNRLNDKMPLQLDSTVLYALKSRNPDVTIAQTRDTKSPYNTYLHVGLPPGPIDSPGDTAIRAAEQPIAGHHDWLYFLTVNPQTGQTKFTDSYTVFQGYVQELNAYLAKHHS
jgi:UPF0755 protein